MTFAHVNVARESEVKHWTREFEVTEEQLRRAVVAVGPNPERVRRFLTLSWMLARPAPRLGRPEAGL